MIQEVQRKYCNIIREIMVYLNLCISCQKKSALSKRDLVTKPILHSAFNSREK